ncbi:hypothetical protein P7K49_005812 [Saguinus oedipus]|uniref:Vegetative cell wall protein gp1-like n=1 Tax=Saguinus oedipus TaxID=9490 RepID=A0ABQ9W0M1_SAGOE|nr:hypothetical protein P7K49_005812 [Saguinus oedipus]
MRGTGRLAPRARVGSGPSSGPAAPEAVGRYPSLRPSGSAPSLESLSRPQPRWWPSFCRAQGECGSASVRLAPGQSQWKEKHPAGTAWQRPRPTARGPAPQPAAPPHSPRLRPTARGPAPQPATPPHSPWSPSEPHPVVPLTAFVPPPQPSAGSQLVARPRSQQPGPTARGSAPQPAVPLTARGPAPQPATPPHIPWSPSEPHPVVPLTAFVPPPQPSASSQLVAPPHSQKPHPHSQRSRPAASGPTPTARGPTPAVRGPTPTTSDPTPTARGPTPAVRGPTPHSQRPHPHSQGRTPGLRLGAQGHREGALDPRTTFCSGCRGGARHSPALPHRCPLEMAEAGAHGSPSRSHISCSPMAGPAGVWPAAQEATSLSCVHFSPEATGSDPWTLDGPAWQPQPPPAPQRPASSQHPP